MRPPLLDPCDPDPADGHCSSSLDHPLFDPAEYITPSYSPQAHSALSFDEVPSSDNEDYREQDLIGEELASYNEDAARSEEEGWFYSDDDDRDY